MSGLDRNRKRNQIIFHRGIPFDVTLPANKSLSIETLSEEKLEKGHQDMLAGRTKSAKQVFNDIHM